MTAVFTEPVRQARSGRASCLFDRQVDPSMPAAMSMMRCRPPSRAPGSRRRAARWLSSISASRGPETTIPPGPSPKSAVSRVDAARAAAAARGRASRPTPPASALSATQRASPPSETSWALASAPARTASRTNSSAFTTAARSNGGSPARKLAAQAARAPRPPSEGAERPHQRHQVGFGACRRVREGARAGAPRVGQLPDHADDGVG